MLPTWAVYVLAATAAVLAVLLGVWWLLRRYRRRLAREIDRLEIANESLSLTGGRFARGVHDLRETPNQMRWGRGPRE